MSAAAACANRSLTFPHPFRILAVSRTSGHEDRRARGRLMGRVDQGQDPAVRSLRRRHRRLPHRGHAARPQRAGPVRLPRPQPWPPIAPRQAAHGRLGRGRPRRGEKRAERAAVQAAARPGRRSSPGADGDRAAPAAGDLRRRRGGPGGRPPGGVRIAEERWAQAWGPAGIAYHVATRPFLAGLEAPWIDEWRRRLEEVRLRGLECFAAASLGLGGPALAQAEERARMLTDACALPRDRAPHPDGSARAARQHRRSAPRLRAATSPAPGGARDRAQPRPCRPSTGDCCDNADS